MANVSPQYIAQQAQARGVDPKAALAVGSQEGLSGGIGDGGHAFGPFQVNDAGGVLTNKFPGWTTQQKQSWAWSPAGVNFALDGIAGVAKGLSGPEAVKNIVSRYERPANPGKEISGALNAYGKNAPPLSTSASQPSEPAPNNARSALVSWALNSSKAFLNDTAQPDLLGLVGKLVAPTKAQPNMPNVYMQGPASGRAKGALSLAQEYIGTPYKWGGESPNGFDCSGLLQYVWAKQGVNIPRTTYDQFQSGVSVNKTELQPGDAVFFKGADPKGDLPGHVGMYIGGGRFIEAPKSGSTVHISYLQGRGDFAGARRFA